MFATPVNRPQPASRRTIYIILLVFVLAFIGMSAGMWYMLSSDSGVTSRFKAGLRLPQSVPEWLGRSGGRYSSEVRVRTDRILPYLVFNWNVCQDTDYPHKGFSLSLAYGEMEMDLGSQDKTSIDVDGVQGWLWHLGSQDFVRPESSDEYSALTQDWTYDRSIYKAIFDARIDVSKSPTGEAIAIQWNREDIHYLLFAKDREPMTEDVLIQIANSMAPSKYPSMSDIDGRGLRCSS
jgi:hypothetical protein